jgi:hypothetical protein
MSLAKSRAFDRQTKSALSTIALLCLGLPPRNVKKDREVAKLHGGFMASARKINRVRDIVTFGILGLLGLLVALLYCQLYNLKENLKSEVSVAKDHAQDTIERLTSLEREVGQIQQNQSSIGSNLTRLENQISIIPHNSPPISKPPATPPDNALRITPDEKKLVREFLEKVNGLDPIVEFGYKVGDKIPSDKLRDFSVVLTEKVPTLKKARYTIDQRASVIIVSEEDRVVAILSTTN